MRSGIVFDLDGTLVDSYEFIRKRFWATFEQFGTEKITHEFQLSLVGPPALSVFQKIYSAEVAEQALSFYRTISPSELGTSLVLFSGLEELLHDLAKKKIPLGIATSKYEQEALDLLSDLGIRELFSSIHGADMLGNQASKVEILGRVIRDFAADGIENSIMVGDRVHDIHAAQELDVQSIFVAWGGAERTEGQAATYIVQEPEELALLLHMICVDSNS